MSDELLEEVQIGNMEAQAETESPKESCRICNSVIEVTDIFCGQCGEKN